MSPAQVAALMMLIADLRIERDGFKAEAIRLLQENEVLKAQLESKEVTE